jgi:hypothetical protein
VSLSAHDRNRLNSTIEICVLFIFLGVFLGACRGFSQVPLDAAPPPVDQAATDGPSSPDSAPDSAVPACQAGEIFSADVDDYHEPGRHTAIAVEASGVIHITHYAAGPAPDMFGNGGYHDARYSRYKDGAWQSEDIYESGVIGGEMAMALDGSGQVHLVFYDYQNKDLLYSTGMFGNWQSPERIATEGIVGWGNDLVIDPQGNIHVVTVSGEQESLIYLRREKGEWQTGQPLASVSFGYQSGLALDKGGKLHASIISAGSLKHLSGEPTAFSEVEILEGGLKEAASDIATTFPGNVHLVYRDATDDLAYREKIEGNWSEKRILDSTSALSQDFSIVASESADLWVVYHDETAGDLRLSHRIDGKWRPPRSIDTAGHVGGYPSAALGPEGALHIAHYNKDNRALRYTRICPNAQQ